MSDESNGFKNARFLLVGGSGGIGSETARRLRDRGAEVAIAGHTKEKVESVCEEVGAHPFTCDATDFDSVEETVSDAAEKMGGLDGVVNLVGSIVIKPPHLVDQDLWRETIDKNLTSAFAVVRSAGQAMAKGDDGGSIVLMTTVAARVGLPNHEPIAAAKAGLIGLAQASAASLALRGVRVNCVAPGLTRTPLSQPIVRNEASEKASIAMHPLGRLGEPADIARMILTLLDPENSWITGQVFGVDGGLSTARGRPNA